MTEVILPQKRTARKSITLSQEPLLNIKLKFQETVLTVIATDHKKKLMIITGLDDNNLGDNNLGEMQP